MYNIFQYSLNNKYFIYPEVKRQSLIYVFVSNKISFSYFLLYFMCSVFII